MSDPISIQGELRSIRKRAGLTQQRLAERLGCSPKRIANIEGGVRRPNLELIGLWAEACGRRFVFGFAPASGFDASVEGTIATLRAAPAEVQRAVASLLEQVGDADGASLGALEAHVSAWRQAVQSAQRRGGA